MLGTKRAFLTRNVLRAAPEHIAEGRVKGIELRPARVGNSQLHNFGARRKMTTCGPWFKMIKAFKMAAAEVLSLVVAHM